MSRAALPLVSGNQSVAAAIVCLATAAILVPVSVHLPRWVEVELVLGAWWLVWTVLLSTMLWRGATIVDDSDATPPVERIGTRGPWDGLSTSCLTGGAIESPMGCVVAIAAVLALLLVGFLVFEIALPGVAAVLYWVVFGMLSRVVNTEHGCEGRALRSLGLGAAWAALYTVPVAAAVCGFLLVLQTRS